MWDFKKSVMPPKKENSIGRVRRKKYRLINLPSPGELDREFIREAIRGLRPFQYDLKQVPADERMPLSNRSMGVGVAVPDNSEVCGRLLDLVRELGVGAVRLDLTYRHDFERADELIEGLNELGVGLLLHPVLPLEEAELMPDQEALGRWTGFLDEILDRYEDRIEAVEIGSTINRAKWTRLSLAGFLEAWESASREVRKRGLTLLGPNVTDFEPQYNAGLLGMLKKREKLPDIHSNNLFAERATEPENLDHKIMGPRLTWVHGFNLKKKIRLLGAIAGRHGIDRTWSTSAFWTLPRIEDVLTSSEEQMADYLARYYTICFSEAAFERIYWGPLISAREGLLDDGTGYIPPSTGLDVVALHDRPPGEPEGWRKRPAFEAFRAMNKLFSGSKFEGTRCADEGLEIHEFSKGDDFFHVAWTKNGQLALLSGCYSEGDLATLEEVRDRSGKVLEERPDFLTQSPVVLVWKRKSAPKVLEGSQVLPKVVVAPSHGGVSHYHFSGEGWRGIVRAGSREEAELLAKHLRPGAIGGKEEEASLRKSRNAVWKIADPRDPKRFLVVKKPRRLAINKRILDRNKPSKAMRSWNGTAQLMRRGIGTPACVAVFESTRPGDMMNNWFICDYLPGDVSVKTFFGGFAAGEETVKGYSFDEFTDLLIDFLMKLHDRGCCFRDLSGGNLLIRCREGGGPEFSLIDTARMRCQRTRLTVRQRMSDLKRLVLKMTPSQQEVFMSKYMKRLKKTFTFSQKVSLKLYALKTDLKRQKRRISRMMGRKK